MAIIIHVAGTALSPGWTDAKLAEEPDGGADNTVKTYKFVATSPPMPDANRSTQPIEAEIRVEALSPDIKTIRIVIKIIRVNMSFQVRETGLSFELQLRSMVGGNAVRCATA